MSSESRQCQNCKKDFTIDSEDFNFYEKIKVPPPTWCPECRFIRRYIWRNERSLYKRKSNVPGATEDIVSMYAPEKNYVVYDEKYWWSDKWDPLIAGQEYDFSKPFFKQYKELLERTPLISLSVTNNVSSSYCNVSAEEKGCYMISASGLNENTMYSNRIASIKESSDLYIGDKNQLCYELVDSNNCFRVTHSIKANNCVESSFLYDCVNCQNCLGCVGLRNKNYHIFNKPYSRDEYLQKISQFDLGSFESVEKIKQEFQNLLKDFPRRYADNINCVNTTGDNVRNSKNVQFAFDTTGAEDCKFLTWVYMGIKDSYDVGAGSGIKGERLYETWDTNFSSQNVFFSGVIYACFEVQYSWNCHGSNNLFGCYGLRNKEYCILNKQYSKEEYRVLLPKIIEHMNTMPFQGEEGRIYGYGEYFPLEISPFAYNETIAEEYFPITKNEAIERKLKWRDREERNYTISATSSDLPDNIKDVSDKITEEIISCNHSELHKHPFNCESSCTTAFRIIPQELALYINLHVPLPRVCPNCRHARRLQERNPICLWNRTCMCDKQNHFHGEGKCTVEFETSYSPDRPEIIYCEKCYQAEVY
ncbi:hypothetical protein K2P96_01265 [Patescibacteria group bacterium]|nr:hypothetical protein [Patescibacteria group bacterium]